MAFTDWLDGYLARKWKVVSEFGKLWDPIADKILINSIMITLSVFDYIHFGITIVFVIRDIVIDGLRMLALHYHVIVAANKYGKLKTIFQMLAICFSLFLFGMKSSAVVTPNSQIWYWFGQMLLYWIALFFAILSLAIYYFKIMTVVKIEHTLRGVKIPSKVKPS